MSERIYNGMLPLMIDMVSATAGPEVGKMLANAPLGTKPFNPDLPCSPRENMKLLLEHKVPKYLPMSGDTYPITPDIICERSYDNLTGPDWFGCLWTFEPGIGATMVKPGDEMIDTIEGWRNTVKFPDLDALDWAECAQGIAKYYDDNRMSDWWLQVGLFERLHSLMGMENALMALLEDEDEVAEFFDALTEHKVKIIKKLTSHFRVEMICYHDDWGYNKDGFIPPKTFERLIAPNLKKVVKAAHEGGAYFNLHSDGRIERYIPYVIEAGVDMWNPAQTVNNLATIKREYGDRLVLNGGMDEKWLNNPQADEDKLRAYVQEKVDLLGTGGGFFASPATFTGRNKAIMTDELRKYGRHFYEK
ncbi:hypothetical protein NXH76_08265 [Blautia schinkii]|nr:hypothetical protein [Blautia schinkii]